jgi:hypothetical protein
MWRIESPETRIVKERAWKTEIAVMQKVRHPYLEGAVLAALSIESSKEELKRRLAAALQSHSSPWSAPAWRRFLLSPAKRN